MQVSQCRRNKFDKHTSKSVATKVITLNNFVFNSKHYLQIKGSAMGTICTPSYANIFMDHFEKKYIYPFLQRLSLIYLPFIDDIFFIWTGTKEQLRNCLNNFKNTILSSLNIKYHNLASHFLIQKSLLKITNLSQKSIRKALTTRASFIWIQTILNC